MRAAGGEIKLEIHHDDLPKLHRPFKFHRRAALADEGSTSRKHDDEVQLYARSTSWRFEGDDLRKLPLAPSEEQSCTAISASTRRHICQRVRTGRDRAGPVPAG